MNGSLEGKVAIISGASRGLGKALTLGFAEKHVGLAIFARDIERLENLSKELHSLQVPYLCYSFDIRDELAVQAFIEAVMNKFNKIDILVNNASVIGPRVELSSLSTPAWKEVIDINLTGSFVLTKQVLPIMKEQHSGSIINVSSSVGKTNSKDWGAYGPSKFALEGLTQGLADEVSQFGIRVNSIDPGAIATEMRRKAYPTENQRKLKKPDEILDLFYYLASGESKDITGQAFKAQEFRLPVLQT